MSIEIEKVIGMASPLLGFTISLTDVSDWLRVVSLLVGIAVGVVSFIHIRQKTRYLKKQNEKSNTNT
jgi:hypothetical protein